jgi:hypothetical protein
MEYTRFYKIDCILLFYTHFIHLYSQKAMATRIHRFRQISDGNMKSGVINRISSVSHLISGVITLKSAKVTANIASIGQLNAPQYVNLMLPR